MRVYLSHSIRGPKGKNATHTDMKENCDEAIRVGCIIREQLKCVDLYIPAEHEEFVDVAFQHKILSIKQILEVDCLIIDTCDAVVFYCPPDDCVLQGGRLIEFNHTIRTNKSPCIFDSPIQPSVSVSHRDCLYILLLSEKLGSIF